MEDKYKNIILHHNEDLVKSVVGQEYLQKSIDNCLDLASLTEANFKIASALYGNHLARLIKEEETAAIARLYQKEVKSNILESVKIPSEINLDEIGLVLIRPELMDNLAECQEFLSNKNLEIIYEKDLLINFQQYWGLYNIGLSYLEKEKIIDFPTRTANYINLPCHLLILKGSHLNGVSELLTSLKGRAGEINRKTIRGSIAITALSSFINKEDCSDFHQEYRMVFDLIGIYRNLVSGKIKSDDSHKSVDIPLLFYAGQGVHIPDKNELEDNLKILLDQTEIDSLL